MTHPTPWRIVVPEPPWDTDPEVFDANGAEVFFISNEERLATSKETLELIVRLVNLEGEIVAALEAAEQALLWSNLNGVLEQVRAVLAKVRP